MSFDADVGTIEAFLRSNTALQPVDEVTVAPLGDGNANETLLLTWGETEYVVRLPPPIDVAPYLLNDLAWEYAVLDALDGSAVPTPSVVVMCEDPSILGAEFYVMERVAGDVMTDTELARIDTRAHRRAVAHETVDALAALHTVDYESVGLMDNDRDTRSLAAELDRLSAQLQWAIEETASARRDAEMVHGTLHETEAWLRDNLPSADHRTFIHGDYKLDNLLWAPDLPVELGAVLDWEMSRIGDPRTDLGWLLAFWYEKRDPNPLTDHIRETYADHAYVDLLELFALDYSRFMEHDHYPTRRALVDRYEEHTGIAFTDNRFFRTLGVYKLAAILESFYRSYLEHPDHAKATYPAMELLVPTLAVSADRLIAGDIPL